MIPGSNSAQAVVDQRSTSTAFVAVFPANRDRTRMTYGARYGRRSHSSTGLDLSQDKASAREPAGYAQLV